MNANSFPIDKNPINEIVTVRRSFQIAPAIKVNSQLLLSLFILKINQQNVRENVEHDLSINHNGLKLGQISARTLPLFNNTAKFFIQFY